MACCSTIIPLIAFVSVVYVYFFIDKYNLNTFFVPDENIENIDTNETDINPFIEQNVDELKSQAIIELPNYGSIRGSINFTTWTKRPIFQFLNVPYAESPSGPLRFKAPVPVKPWNGTRNAEKYGLKCPAYGDLNELIENEQKGKDIENCLFLAIFTRDLNGSLPVMVYIHGGGFYSNNADHYPPNYMMERDIVLVVIQYRLDVLGFLSTGTEEIPGNAGLLDSIQALRFIKENIVYFGGDPNKITIFGQSSGAAMVSALLISPSVEDDLFHQAILQSGSILANWAYTTEPISDARKIAAAAGLNPNQSIAMLNKEFMEMSALDLLKAADTNTMKDFMDGKTPKAGRSLSIGGQSNLLPDLPENLIKSVSYNKSVPIIIGTTKDDGSYVASVIYDYLAATNKLNDTRFMVNDLIATLCKTMEIKDVTGSFGDLTSLTFWTDEQLASADFGVMAPGIIDMLGMNAFKSPVLAFARKYAEKNPFETFLFTFDYKGEHTRFGYGGDTSHYPFSGGVHHSDDLIYLFPDPPDVAKLNKEDTKIAQIMVDLWTSFATNGIPEVPRTHRVTKAFQWPSFTGPYGTYLHIDKNLEATRDFRKEFTVESRKYTIH